MHTRMKGMRNVKRKILLKHRWRMMSHDAVVTDVVYMYHQTFTKAGQKERYWIFFLSITIHGYATHSLDFKTQVVRRSSKEKTLTRCFLYRRTALPRDDFIAIYGRFASKQRQQGSYCPLKIVIPPRCARQMCQ